MARWSGSSGRVIAIAVAFVVGGCGRFEINANPREIQGDGWEASYRTSGDELVLRLDHEGLLGMLRVFGDGRVLALRYDRVGDSYSSFRLNEYELRLAQDVVDDLVRQIMETRRDEWFPMSPGVHRKGPYRPPRAPRVLFRLARIRRGERVRESFEGWAAPTTELRDALEEIIESEDARRVQEEPPPKRPLWSLRSASEAPRLLVEHGRASRRTFSVVDRLGLKRFPLFTERVDPQPGQGGRGGSAMLMFPQRRPAKPRSWSLSPCCCTLQWPEINQAGPLDRDEIEATARQVLRRTRACVSDDGALAARRLEPAERFLVEADSEVAVPEVAGQPIGWAAAGVLYFSRRTSDHLDAVHAMTPSGRRRQVLIASAFLLSPDGRRAAYITGRDRNPYRARDERCLWTMDLAHDGFPQPGIPGRRIACGVSSFDWSPDGRELAYAWANRDEYVRRLSRRPVDGRPPRTLYGVESGGWFPVLPNWSPDGTVVAFVRRWGNSNRMQPFRYSTDTPSLQEILRGRHPDTVWVVGAHGTDPLEVAEGWAVRWLGERRGPWP